MVIILNHNVNNINFSFKAKKSAEFCAVKSLKEIADTLDITKMPEKIELTPFERIANDLLLNIKKLNRELRTQKSNLFQFYSAQDKYDYQELLKQRRSAESKFKRLAKKTSYTDYDLKYLIEEKKDYNFFAPKIFRANTIEELYKIKTKILEYRLFYDVENLLIKLISLREKILKAK